MQRAESYRFRVDLMGCTVQGEMDEILYPVIYYNTVLRKNCIYQNDTSSTGTLYCLSCVKVVGYLLINGILYFFFLVQIGCEFS